ncbi:MAG TPA: TolC family protein [Phenylobacterium sp.]|uniref:TolC family protein n=1 Tax=Phenylobacterium sp. TaxID=1871053 RepID=UPI002B491FAE|nr:TolC family protein [Phenylobacterium sp.]HKR88788.1 TolC family protein [Phenylobacterium sp.]
MSSPSRWRPRCAVWLSTSALALAAGATAAAPAPPYSVLLRQAERAPRLAEADAAVDQARGLARQAAARPNPVVGVEVENFAGTGPFQGTKAAETTASLQQTLELGGKRAARIAAGRADVVAAEARSAQARADFAFDLADAYARAEAADRRLTLARDSLGLAQEDARIAAALVRAGKEADVRAVQARAALKGAQADVDAAVAGRANALEKLSALAGVSEAFTSLASSLLARADRDEPFRTPAPAASPTVASAETARNAAARRVKVEQTRSAPDLTVSLGLRRLAGEDATAMVGGVSVPLPVFDRNRGGVSAAQAELRAAEARLDAARLDAQADARAGLVRMAAAQSRIRAAHEGETAAEEAYRLTRLGYQGGKLPLGELLVARRALTDARTQTLDAQLERLSAEAELARLAGAVPFGDQP